MKQHSLPYPCVLGTRVGSIHSIGLVDPDFQRVQTPSQHSGKGPTSPAAPTSQTRAEMQDRTPKSALSLSWWPCVGPCLYIRKPELRATVTAVLQFTQFHAYKHTAELHTAAWGISLTEPNAVAQGASLSSTSAKEEKTSPLPAGTGTSVDSREVQGRVGGALSLAEDGPSEWKG
jgi:hypothetical protein